jgi:beta-lactamase regulating signal transducer with metallopeptidase domain
VFDAIAQTLWQQTLLLALSSLAVLLLRGLALRWLGAGAAYLLWLCVPAACLGALLPGPRLWPNLAPLPIASIWQPLATAPANEWAASVSADRSGTAVDTLLGLWLIGALLLSLRIVLQHQRMLGLLGSPPADAVRRTGPRAMAVNTLVAPAGCGPLLIGLWRPRLCLPADFQTRFDAAEQAAIVQHEDMHRRRHDNAWNLLGTGLLVLHWFNPLAWLALRRMRADQELSCDAAVLQQTPAPSAAVYILALLKSQGLQTSLSPTGLMRCTDTGSAWLSVHPLIERVSMLKQHHLFASRRHTATGLVAAAALLFAGGGHALQSTPLVAPPGATADSVNKAQAAPPPAPATAGEINTVMVTMSLEVDGKTVAKPWLFGALGAPMLVRWKADDAPATGAWEIEITTTAGNTPGQLMFSGKLSTGEPLRVVSQPRLVTAEGQTASVQIGAEGGRPALKLTLKGQRMAQPERAALPTSTLR